MRSKHPEVRWWRNENTRDHGQIMISGHNFAENINWKRKARRYTGMEHSPQLKCKEWKRECIKHFITLCILLFLQFSKIFFAPFWACLLLQCLFLPQRDYCCSQAAKQYTPLQSKFSGRWRISLHTFPACSLAFLLTLH